MPQQRVLAVSVFALGLTVFPLGACTSSQLGASASLDKSASPRGILLTVDNRNAADARLYLLRSGLRVRLATLGSHERRTMALPVSYLAGQSGLVLQAELLASRETHQTQPVVAVVGDRLHWIIAHRLPYSRVSVHR